MLKDSASPLPFSRKSSVVEIIGTEDAHRMVDLFEATLRVFLSDPAQTCANAGSPAISAMLTEGIPLEYEACAFAVALPSAQRLGRRLFVSFVGVHGRPRCAELSVFSASLRVRRCPMPTSIEQARTEAINWLTQVAGPKVPVLRMAADPLALLQRAAAVVWSDALPGLLVPDLLGIYPCTPTDVRTLARNEIGLPSSHAHDLWQPDIDADIDGPDEFDSMASESNAAMDQLCARLASLMADIAPGNIAVECKKAIDGLKLIYLDHETDAVACRILDGTFGLLASGTLTKSLPSKSILVRYSAQQAAAIRAHPREALGLAQQDPRSRGATYQRWWSAASTPSDARPALKAYDLHLCARYDLEPAIFADEPPSYPSPSPCSLLWMHEINKIERAIHQAARTPDIARVALGILAIVRFRPSRPGHLIHARRSDVITLSSDQVVHVVRRRRGGQTAKTEAALGPMTFSDKQATQNLLSQKGYVLARDGEPDGFLWGPTQEEAKRLFREAVLMISRLCRWVTGDPAASFYTLRHSVFTHRLVEIMTPGRTLSDPDALNRLLSAGGHVHAQVTMQHYFHLPMVVIRAYADRRLERMLTPDMASRWLA
jgi:hypothetical protein